MPLSRSEILLLFHNLNIENGDDFTFGISIAEISKRMSLRFYQDLKELKITEIS